MFLKFFLDLGYIDFCFLVFMRSWLCGLKVLFFYFFIGVVLFGSFLF